MAEISLSWRYQNWLLWKKSGSPKKKKSHFLEFGQYVQKMPKIFFKRRRKRKLWRFRLLYTSLKLRGLITRRYKKTLKRRKIISRINFEKIAAKEKINYYKRKYKNFRYWKYNIGRRNLAKKIRAWKRLNWVRVKNALRKRIIFKGWNKNFIIYYSKRLVYFNKLFHLKFKKYWLYPSYDIRGIKHMWKIYCMKKRKRFWAKKKYYTLNQRVKFYSINYTKKLALRLLSPSKSVFVLRKHTNFFLELVYRRYRKYIYVDERRKNANFLNFRVYWKHFFYFLLQKKKSFFYYTKGMYRSIIMKKLRSNYYFTLVNGLGQVLVSRSSGSFVKKINERRRIRKIRGKYIHFDDFLKDFVRRLKRRRIHKIKYFLRKSGLKKRFMYAIPYGFSNNRITLGYIKNLAVARHSKKKKKKKKEKDVMVVVFYTLLIFLIVIFITILLIPLISVTLVYQKNYQEKISQYECGFDAYEKDLAQFEIRYYLLAILFLIFDLEIAFMLPYLMAFSSLVCFGAASMVVFFFFLLLAFYYEWIMGGLEWD